MKKNINWFCVCFISFVLRSMPHASAVAVGAGFGRVLWFFSRKRVDKAEKRAVRALGVGVTLARRIVRGSYENLGRSVAEMIRLPLISGKFEKYITLHGEKNLTDAMEKGNGVIFLTSHMGNWEMLAAHVASRGYPMNAIGAEQRDPRITELIVKIRRNSGVKTISKGFNLKSAIKCLKKGEILGVLIDQDVRDKGIIVPFLGLPASTPYGPVKISRKLGSPILPVFLIRKEKGPYHDLYILPPLEDPSGKPFGEDILSSTAEANRVLSQWIARYPDHWMWLYPRWASTLGDR